MVFPLEGAPRRLLGLIASLILATLLILQAGKNWIANYRINSGRLDLMRRGAALTPGNGEGWDRLGHFMEFDLADPDPYQAIAYYQRALHDDPFSSYYWLDLAGAYEDAGNISDARNAYERARAAYPASAWVAWNYGSFLLRQQDYSAGYEQIRSAISTDPKLLPLAISRTWRSTQNVNQLFDHVLPVDTDAYLQALDFFSSAGETDAAVAAWQRLIALGKPLALPQTFPFFQELIRADRGDDARRAWFEALAAAGLPHDKPPDDSLVWDGSFTADFTNGGLGWRWDPPVGVEIDFDTSRRPGGGRAIRLDFSGGTNLSLDTPSEYVPVEPGRTYHFHAQMCTKDVSTDSGVRFSLSDPNHPNEVNLATDALTRTTLWKPLDADVTTGPDTHFLVVRVTRYPSQSFDNKLSGSAWITDVSLVPSAAAAKRALP